MIDSSAPPAEPPVDKSLEQNGLWEHVVFTVPDDIPEERVEKERFGGYMQKAGEYWESKDFTVLRVERPRVYNADGPVEPGRRKYVIWGWVRRRPVVHTLDVPDHAVDRLRSMGMVLAD